LTGVVPELSSALLLLLGLPLVESASPGSAARWATAAANALGGYHRALPPYKLASRRD
jgi:hypothetical protein